MGTKLTSHKSFREYLQAVFRERKERNSSYSLTVFSRVLGFGSPQHFSMVLSGKRKIDNAQISEICSHLRLGYLEANYFESLVHFNQSENAKERTFYRRRLLDANSSLNENAQKIDVRSIIEKWYVPAALVALDKRPIATAVSDASKLTGLKLEDVEGLLKKFLDSKMMNEKEGLYVMRENHLWDTGFTNSIDSKKRFLKSQIERTLSDFEENFQKGKFLSHTFSIEKDMLTTYASKIENFIKELTSEAESEVPEKIVQLNIQLLPYV